MNANTKLSDILKGNLESLKGAWNRPPNRRHCQQAITAPA